jgi:phosphomevalonate kinase
MNVRSSAPGKVVLCGEYAVLDGAPAIVMAVDRRARVSLAPANGDWHCVSLPGITERQVAFSTGNAGELIRRDSGATADRDVDLSLLGQVLRAVDRRLPVPLHFALDTRPFLHEAKGLKLGLGSSAALAVALTAALMRDEKRLHGIARTALAAHRAWQEGRGSGVDVAAAVHGGILAYRATSGAATEALRWPEGLRHALLWSGRPSSTSDRIEVFRESVRLHGGAVSLAQAAEKMLDTWRRGDPRAILDGLSGYVRVLEAFDVDRDLGIFDAGHGQLAEVAGGRVVYKPCGAGGGDIGIALALREDDLEEFVVKAEAIGFERLNVMPDSRGVE